MLCHQCPLIVCPTNWPLNQQIGHVKHSVSKSAEKAKGTEKGFEGYTCEHVNLLRPDTFWTLQWLVPKHVPKHEMQETLGMPSIWQRWLQRRSLRKQRRSTQSQVLCSSSEGSVYSVDLAGLPCDLIPA